MNDSHTSSIEAGLSAVAQAADSGGGDMVIWIVLAAIAVIAVLAYVFSKGRAEEEAAAKRREEEEKAETTVAPDEYEEKKDELSLAEIKDAKQASADLTREEKRKLRAERRAATQTAKAKAERAEEEAPESEEEDEEPAEEEPDDNLKDLGKPAEKVPEEEADDAEPDSGVLDFGTGTPSKSKKDSPIPSLGSGMIDVAGMKKKKTAGEDEEEEPSADPLATLGTRKTRDEEDEAEAEEEEAEAEEEEAEAEEEEAEAEEEEAEAEEEEAEAEEDEAEAEEEEAEAEEEEAEAEEEEAEAEEEEAEAEEEEAEPKSLRDGLSETRNRGFIARLGKIFGGKMDESVVEQLEEVLFTADIGVKTSQALLDKVENQLSRKELSDGEKALAFLREEVREILERAEQPLEIGDQRPFVILVVGVNGAGKTTTIGKLAAKFVADDKKVLLVAGDTFRAAAIEQLEEWGARTGCRVHKDEQGSDPSAVIYDGLQLAEKEDFDIVLADTAGRLHNKKDLVDELKKITRVSGKALDGAPHHTLLVLDATNGQNALQQAKEFREAVDYDGIVLTKLDGTAKGGVIIGICDEMRVPVHYIGIGEMIDDMRPFEADEFVEALF